ncbi:MAG: hypothetical protein ACLRIS_17680 [Flavonifractor plautii]
MEETVAAVKRAHPYEEPVINVIPLTAPDYEAEPVSPSGQTARPPEIRRARCLLCGAVPRTRATNRATSAPGRS